MLSFGNRRLVSRIASHMLPSLALFFLSDTCFANVTLSERRATAVKSWLLENLEPGHGDIEVLGYGESQPVADNGNFQGRQRNRRVVIRVIK